VARLSRSSASERQTPALMCPGPRETCGNRLLVWAQSLNNRNERYCCRLSHASLVGTSVGCQWLVSSLRF